MSERVIRDCDGCGKPGITTPKIRIPYGWQENSADARTEESVETVDLCETCAGRALAFLTLSEGFTVEQGAKLRGEIRVWKKKFPDSGRP